MRDYGFFDVFKSDKIESAINAGLFDLWPVEGEKRLTALFGRRISKGSTNHPGIDIGVEGGPGGPRGNTKIGKTVFAIGNGEATIVPLGKEFSISLD